MTMVNLFRHWDTFSRKLQVYNMILCKQDACRHHWVQDVKRRKSKFAKILNSNQAVVCQSCGKRSVVQDFVNEVKLKLDVGPYKIGDTIRLCDLLIGDSYYESELVMEIYNLLFGQINNDSTSTIKLRHPDWLKEVHGPIFAYDAPIVIEPSRHVSV